MADTDTTKVDVNAKADALDASDASNIDTTNINMKRGIVKPCAVAMALYCCMSMIKKVL